MSNKSCNCNYSIDCSLLSIAASIIIGVIAAFLTITATITVTPAFLWVTFGIAVVYLAITLITAPFTSNQYSCCKCSKLNILFTGILGTILTSVILLAISFVATSIIGAIITGLLLLFFTLTITETVCLVKCLANCSGNSATED